MIRERDIGETANCQLRGGKMMTRVVQNGGRKTLKGYFIFIFPIIFLLGINSSVVWSAEDSYPNRPINMIIPYAPGGGSDLGSKIVADKMSAILGQPLISVYKPGAGGVLGAAFVAKAKPDGYTVLAGVGVVTLALYPSIKEIDYSLDDFILLGGYGKPAHCLVVKSDAKWKTLKEFLDDEKKSPGTLKVGSYGKLSPSGFLVELINKHANIKLAHIPYKSSGEAVTSVLGGHVDAAAVAGAGGLLEAGKIRILAVAEDKRLEGIYNLPTFKECGYPFRVSAPYCFAFPKGTPKEIVEKFTSARAEAFRIHSKEIQESMKRVELWAQDAGPKEIAEIYQEEFKAFYSLSKELGLVTK